MTDTEPSVGQAASPTPAASPYVAVGGDRPQQGVGVTWPSVPGRGFEWLPGGEVDELSGFLDLGHFVMSDDGWVTTRNSSKLVVFDAAGGLVVNEDVEFIRDARFAPGGGPLYVATEDRNAAHDTPPEATLLAIDRATGDILRETTLPGTVTANAVSEDRLWIARAAGPEFGGGGELFVELLDPETFEIRRSIAVAWDLAAPGLGRVLWPFHGLTPVLLEDATGTRLTYTGFPQDFAGLWTHVVEVG